MYMPYTTNPHLPHVRMEAVKLVRAGWSTRTAARHLGFSQGAIVKWVRRAPPDGRMVIPTMSSRPHRHPRQLSLNMVQTILSYRERTRRCAEVIHHLLGKDGYAVSLSSVKRVLRRHGYVNHTKWKKWHRYPPRPVPEKPGILVEIDTLHDGPHEDRLYVYAMIDVCSRWGYASATERITVHRSFAFVEAAQAAATFQFTTLQSDHGSEFSRRFSERVACQGFAHRHSRVRTPTDNGHVERFIRTIQEECLGRSPRSLTAYRRALPDFLHYYNTERPHLGLGMKSPVDILQRFQAID